MRMLDCHVGFCEGRVCGSRTTVLRRFTVHGWVGSWMVNAVEGQSSRVPAEALIDMRVTSRESCTLSCDEFLGSCEICEIRKR